MTHIDHESVLFHAILNDDSSLKLFGLNRFVAPYNDKELREAANELVNQSQFLIPSDTDIVTGENKSRKRKIVDAEERAQSSRDRNREHAKNTRLRKKAYVIKLKDLVDQLKSSKIAESEERQHIANQLLSLQSRRKANVMQFLKYRSQNVRSRVQWASILDESFSLILPITPFRYFNKNEIEEGRRVLRGIDNIIADTASLALMIECVGHGSQIWKECTKRGEFHKLLLDISPNDLVCSGDNVFCRFNMRLVHERTMLTSCLQSAMLHCRMDQNDRLLTAELVFDVMHFINQLQCANTIFPESSIVPNTLDMVLLESSEARAIITRSSPHTILYVNQAWTALTGNKQCDMEGLDFVSLFSSAQQALPSVHGLLRGCSRAIPGRVIIDVVETSLFKQISQADIDNCTERHICYMKMIPLTSQSPTDVYSCHDTAISHFLVSLLSLEN